MAQIFALYKGDVNLCDGTIEQIASYLGVTVKTAMFYGAPSYQKRGATNNRLALVKIDEDEDD